MSIVRLNLSGHQNSELENMGFIFPGTLHVDLADPQLVEKLTEFLKKYVDSGDTVIMTPAGLAELALLQVTIIHGLTGHFPRLQTLRRDPVSNTFVPVDELRNLQEIRNDIARKERADVIVL